MSTYYDPAVGAPFRNFTNNERVSRADFQRLAPQVSLFSAGDTLPDGRTVDEAGDLLVGYPIVMQKLTIADTLRLQKVAIFEAPNLETLRKRKQERYDAALAHLEAFSDPSAVLIDPDTFSPFTCDEKRAQYIRGCEATVARLKADLDSLSA